METTFTEDMKWLLFLPRKQNPKVRVFCFPYAGGNPNIFREWCKFLPESVEVVSVVLPGRYSRIKEDNIVSWPELLEHLERVITPWLNIPYILFGHSFGARIIYELARKIQINNMKQPEMLFITGCRCPHILGPMPYMYDLPSEEFYARVTKMNGTPVEILSNKDFLKIMEPSLRADMQLSEPWTGSPNNKISSSIIAVSGVHDDIDPPSKMIDWSQYTTSTYDFHSLNGDHFFLHSNQGGLLSIINNHVEFTLNKYHTNKSIKDAFEEQVLQHADQVALIYKDETLTYKELNSKANKLAHYLVQNRVLPGDIIAICLERSFDMVVVMLAILKAGAAYMPLDVDYPPERLQYMMDDAKIKMIVTQTKFVSLLQFDTAILNIDHQMKYINAQSNENLQNISCTGDSPAYINYTSGSTGKPKGVVVLHKGVIRLVHKTNYAQLDANQTFLQLASVSFDATTFELWGALLNGAKCVLFEDKFPTLNKLQECIQKNQISILFITTALFNLVIDEDPNIFKNITQILTGGEAHSVNHMYKAVTNLPNVKFTNVYGPTENTTFSTFYHIDNISSTDKTIPIGKPISNTFAYVLNEERIPVLTGEIGELYLGGVGLAQGYLYAPEITASKFIKNLPFLPADEHLYKTGDLVRMNSDDNLEFIGRIDNQVKINGFRVELEEIECHLKSFPNIKQAIVIASHKGLHNRLIAYVVADKKVALINEIKEYLRLRLPSYMIPTFIYNLDALPLTKNGKIDRKELEGMVA